MEKTNYILHLNKAFEKICEDNRLTPFHISLYFALFHYWNIAKFRNPISISRDEMMRAAKIGSVNTYIRCIKELHAWNYIQYHPSFNPQKGSQVHLYKFDKAINKATDNRINNGNHISAANSIKKATAKAPVKAGKTLLIPSTNNLNSINKSNKQKNENTKSQRSGSSEEPVSFHSGKTDEAGAKRKVAPKEKVTTGDNARFKRPLLSSVKKHFQSNNWSVLEAEKFFNYYQSNGWLIGGKSAMQSWKAAAGNWILNSLKFNSASVSTGREVKRAASHLHTLTEKNYHEPL